MSWNDIDRRCEHCGNVVEKAKGINKQNLKKLIRFTGDDLIFLVILILVLLSAYAYKADIKKCALSYESEEFQSCLANISQKALYPEANELCRAGFEEFCNEYRITFNFTRGNATE